MSEQLGENEYRCAQCGRVFSKKWSDEEAMAESRNLFGELRPEELATICDACFEELKKKIGASVRQ